MEDEVNQKVKTRDILIEIDNIKKYVNNLTNNVQSEKIESYIDVMNQNISKLQNETESFYNENYNTNNE